MTAVITRVCRRPKKQRTLQAMHGGGNAAVCRTDSTYVQFDGLMMNDPLRSLTLNAFPPLSTEMLGACVFLFAFPPSLSRLLLQTERTHAPTTPHPASRRCPSLHYIRWFACPYWPIA